MRMLSGGIQSPTVGAADAPLLLWLKERPTCRRRHRCQWSPGNAALATARTGRIMHDAPSCSLLYCRSTRPPAPRRSRHCWFSGGPPAWRRASPWCSSRATRGSASRHVCARVHQPERMQRSRAVSPASLSGSTDTDAAGGLAPLVLWVLPHASRWAVGGTHAGGLVAPFQLGVSTSPNACPHACQVCSRSAQRIPCVLQAVLALRDLVLGRWAVLGRAAQQGALHFLLHLAVTQLAADPRPLLRTQVRDTAAGSRAPTWQGYLYRVVPVS